jgi:hypothetical protein
LGKKGVPPSPVTNCEVCMRSHQGMWQSSGTTLLQLWKEALGDSFFLWRALAPSSGLVCCNRSEEQRTQPESWKHKWEEKSGWGFQACNILVSTGATGDTSEPCHCTGSHKMEQGQILISFFLFEILRVYYPPRNAMENGWILVVSSQQLLIT